MKNRILKSTFLLFFVSFGFLSCTEIEPVDEPLLDLVDQEPTQNGTMTAMIDGQLFTANEVSGMFISESVMGTPIITVAGIRLPNFDTLRFDVYAGETGVYPLEFISSIITYFDFQDEMYSSSALENEITGNITITSISMSNQTISGTFQGILYNFEEDQTKNVTNGVFTNVPFIIHND